MMPIFNALLLVPMVSLGAATTPCPPECSNPEHGHAAATADATAPVVLTARTTRPGIVTIDREDDAEVSIFALTMIDGDETISIKHDGTNISATVDGREVPASRVRMKDGRVELLDKNGKVEHSLPMSIGRAAAIIGDDAVNLDGILRFGEFEFDEDEFGALQRRFGGAMDRLRLLQDGDFPVAVGELQRRAEGGIRGFVDDNDGFTWTLDGDATPPRSMIGVHLEAPGDVLCAQLGLDRGDVTVITGVLDGLPASRGGLKPFDIIVSVDGDRPAGVNRVREILGATEPGDAVELEVIRRGDRIELRVTPAAHDAQTLAASRLKGRVAGGGSGMAFPGGDDARIFFAPGENEERFNVFERPNARTLRLPQNLGAITLDLEDGEQLRDLADSLGRELRGELRQVLPEMLQETDRGIEEIRRGLRLAEPVVNGVLAQIENLVEDPETVAQIEMMIQEALGDAAEGIHEVIIELDENLPEMMQELEAELEDVNPEMAEQLEGAEAAVREAVERARRAGAEARFFDRGTTPRRVVPGRPVRPVAPDRTGELERRMERIESMLEQLMKRLDRSE